MSVNVGALKGHYVTRVDTLSELSSPIIKGRQLRIPCSDSEWYFSNKLISVTRATTVRMAQIERKWDLIIKT